MARNKYILLAALFGASVLADQGSKYLAVAHLTRDFAEHGVQGVGQQLAHFYGDRNLDGDPRTEPDLRTPPVAVLNDFWHFKYVENPGAAWGLLGSLPENLRLPFFHLVSIAAVTFILVFYRRTKPEQRYVQVALAFVLGGAVGNYLDRVIRGYVIDFVDWHWYQDPRMHWPTFNVADAFICVGVGMLLLEGVVTKRAPKAEVLGALGELKTDRPS
ncbi:MAG: signal peptidase II [Deltaproteobacteria bacterium]|nr:signal peptidase II [Deltaproteobacteria bacterium]